MMNFVEEVIAFARGEIDAIGMSDRGLHECMTIWGRKPVLNCEQRLMLTSVLDEIDIRRVVCERRNQGAGAALGDGDDRRAEGVDKQQLG